MVNARSCHTHEDGLLLPSCPLAIHVHFSRLMRRYWRLNHYRSLATVLLQASTVASMLLLSKQTTRTSGIHVPSTSACLRGLFVKNRPHCRIIALLHSMLTVHWTTPVPRQVIFSLDVGRWQ